MTTETTTTAQQLADRLNEYAGDNEWQDIIEHTPGVDLDASTDERIVLTSGDVVEWRRSDYQGQQGRPWRVV